jgi:hypothetical protein
MHKIRCRGVCNHVTHDALADTAYASTVTDMCEVTGGWDTNVGGSNEPAPRGKQPKIQAGVSRVCTCVSHWCVIVCSVMRVVAVFWTTVIGMCSDSKLEEFVRRHGGLFRFYIADCPPISSHSAWRLSAQAGPRAGGTMWWRTYYKWSSIFITWRCPSVINDTR